jgi:hypothetical protein
MAVLNHLHQYITKIERGSLQTFFWLLFGGNHVLILLIGERLIEPSGSWFLSKFPSG